ncbi:MAG TPA: alpha/beta fold hydrolase [Thermomicrobiaceae bacterium]|nr:alpha/beta fold hydrolase [Thermomicrobiaceae bacterium]
MSIFVLVHGSFSGGWKWKKVVPLLQQAGHQVSTPTLTGLGERSHLVRPDIGLETHITDIVNVLRFNDLENVILAGHSWGGMVITGVAEREPERIARLVYVDAFVPHDGESVFSISPAAGERWRARTVDGLTQPYEPEHWNITDPADAAWLQAHMVAMPIRTHEDPIELPENRAAELPRTYIWCTESAAFASMAQRARDEGMRYFELPTHHNPMVTMPRELSAILLQGAAG